MHYYQFNISDFSQSTKHLTLIERAVYRELIDLYYDKEQPLINDPQRLARLILAPDNVTDVEQVLNEFFTLVDGRWINEKCEQVIEEYQSKKIKASKAGKASAKARANKRKASSDLTDVEQTLNECSTNYKPLTNNHKPDNIGQQVDPIPFQKIADLYNEHLAKPVGLPQVIKVNDKRKRLIKRAWLYGKGAKHESNTIDYWERYFKHLTTIDFLKPEFSRPDNHKNWKADFEYVMREDTWTKVIEGTLSGY